MSEITIQVNGKLHKCANEILLPNLLTQLNLNPAVIAVEYNGSILHRNYWEKRAVLEGDRLEIVTIVGGG